MEDPEIDAMSAVTKALTDLDEDGQGRVLRWAAERFSVSIPTSGRRSRSSSGDQAEEPNDEVTEAEIAEEAPTYDHFAELFAKAQPTTDRDKALVAAYWLQAIQDEGAWQSAALQKELKNLGHASVILQMR